MVENQLVDKERGIHRAKQWEIALFSLNNVGVNVYLFAFSFLTYYSTGVAGFATLMVANMLGAVRLFDGLIDPAIGLIIDKFSSERWGKYRPIMLAANISLVLSFLILFSTHNFTGIAQIIVYIFALFFHKIGYSFQQTIVKAAQPALTNDPKQRPVFTIYDTIFSVLGVHTLGQVIVSNYLAPKHGGEFNLPFFRELIAAVIVISIIVTILAMIGISRKDKPEFYGDIVVEEEKNTNVLKEIWQTVKGNRPLQILAVACAIMKFLGQLVADQAFLVILFGIILGSYGLSGQMALIQIVPNILIIVLLTRLASTKGMKTSYTTSIVAYILSVLLIGAVLFFAPDTTQIFANGWGALAVLFTIGYIGLKTFGSYPNTVVMTMSADIADYELNRTGKNKAGFVSTVFTFAESISSALVPIFIGFAVALIGYTEAYPAVTDSITPELFNLAIFMVVLLPLVLGFTVLFLIRKYPLDKVEMADIQTSLSDKRKQAAKRNEEVASGDFTTDDIATGSFN